MELLDRDGDCIQFLIDARGKLREYVNGKLEIAEVMYFEYSTATQQVKDQTGVFQLQEGDCIEKALGLRALASRAGVAWHGDPPCPASSLTLTDMDGDKLEFVVNDVGKLQEFNNGKLEIQEVGALHFSFADGTVIDDTGSFTLPARECMQKVATLRSLAEQAGIPWTGDEPSQASKKPLGKEPKVLDIEDCASDWEFECPKLWENLKATARPKQRFCETCKEAVYLCETVEELQEHTEQRRCVAYDIREASSATGSAETMMVRAALLSGVELPNVRLAVAAHGRDLKRALAEAGGPPVEAQRLLLNELEITDGMKLADVESIELASTVVQVLHVTPTLPEPRPRPGRERRLVGKKRAARG